MGPVNAFCPILPHIPGVCAKWCRDYLLLPYICWQHVLVHNVLGEDKSPTEPDRQLPHPLH